MAKQSGVIKITGTIGNITFYKMNGEYYARSKSSLSGKRVKKDPNYERFRTYSGRMACASQTAGSIYRSLRKAAREVSLYRKMVSEGLRLLRAGCAEERLEETLRAMFLPAPEPAVQTVTVQETVPQPRNIARAGICVDVKGKLEVCGENAANGAGNIGMGVNLQSAYKLAVAGTMAVRKVKVTQETWADYVFRAGYKLPTIHETEAFINANKHLPGIPSEKEVTKDGIDVGEMNKLLLQKIGEQMLYIIEMNKERKNTGLSIPQQIQQCL